MKCVHLLYQFLVVSGNVDIEVASMRPRKWFALIWQNHWLFCVFILKKFSICFYQGLAVFLLKLEGQNNIYLVSMFGKTTKIPKPKPPLKTNLVHSFQLLLLFFFFLKPFHSDQMAKIDQSWSIFDWIHKKKPNKTL